MVLELKQTKFHHQRISWFQKSYQNSYFLLENVQNQVSTEPIVLQGANKMVDKDKATLKSHLAVDK